ncbi:MAG: uracil-DNA glycosylase [Chloroflexota bacterium]
MDTILEFVTTLAADPPPPDAYNPYLDVPTQPGNAARRANLTRYLIAMQARKPAAMLVMEAPGYRGCRLTGVPVTSRKLLREGVPSLDLFGAAQGYDDPDDPGFERIQGEQSATIVWGVLAELGVVPVIWNTYPFHPHKPGQPLTNRPPRRDEIAHGQRYLRAMLALFHPAQVIAVGRSAEGALDALSVARTHVRHPAQGGKNDFVAGIRAALGT